MIYTAFQRFMELLLQDGAVRTENPWEANMFYVPIFAPYAAGGWAGGRAGVAAGACNGMAAHDTVVA